jgi:CheY-like chemotaxis protein/two-component sensor histidine kinase
LAFAPPSKDDMTVIDPNWEQGRGVAGGPTDRAAELAMLHHDVRGALQGVIGGIGQIDLAGCDGRTREQFERIAAAARTLACLVGELVGDHDNASGDVDFRAFVEHLQHRHAGEARARGLDLVVTAGGVPPRRLALDPMALVRILDNLIGNAIRFTAAGSVRLAADRAPDGGIAFRVSDDGPGAPDAALERISGGGRGGERRVPDASGHGLGLHVVRTMAARLGGTLEAGNRPAGGFEAVVRFPPAAAVDLVVPRDGAAGPGLAGLRVLLAEDNPTNQMVASQMLRALDAEVVVCSDGVEALERFESGHFDLVVVDIEMPRLSGLDVIRAIRARSDVRAGVPIVALTAYAMREHRERIAAAGANGLISKPITSVEALGRGLAAYVARLGGAALPEALAEEEDDDGPVIDMGTFDALAEAIGAETMAELLDKVIADLLGAQGELAAALPGLDQAPIRSASHILISVGGAVGAARLQACARAVNASAHGEDALKVEALVRRCIAEIDAAVDFCRGRRSVA